MMVHRIPIVNPENAGVDFQRPTGSPLWEILPMPKIRTNPARETRNKVTRERKSRTTPASETRNKVTRERIESRRKELGMTLNRVAVLAGFDRSLLRKYINGEVNELGYDKLEAVARVLMVSVAWLRGETADPNPDPAPVPSGENGGDVPVVGIVEAGAFRPVGIVEGMSLGIVPNGYDPTFAGERQFAYLVRGPQMDRVGISDGDAIICVDPWEAGVQMGSGDYVVVEVVGRDGRELTVRELVVQRNSYELRMHSSDSRHSATTLPISTDLRHDQGCRIVGIVTSIIRRRPVRLGVRSSESGGSTRSSNTVGNGAMALVSGIA